MEEALKVIKIDSDLISNHPLLDLVEHQSVNKCNRFDELTWRKLNLLLDLSHRQLTSLITLNACLFRSESRGGHYRVDSPASLPYWECHSIQRRGENISTLSIKN